MLRHCGRVLLLIYGACSGHLWSLVVDPVIGSGARVSEHSSLPSIYPWPWRVPKNRSTAFTGSLGTCSEPLRASFRTVECFDPPFRGQARPIRTDSTGGR